MTLLEEIRQLWAMADFHRRNTSDPASRAYWGGKLEALDQVLELVCGERESKDETQPIQEAAKGEAGS